MEIEKLYNRSIKDPEDIAFIIYDITKDKYRFVTLQTVADEKIIQHLRRYRIIFCGDFNELSSFINFGFIKLNLGIANDKTPDL